MADICLGGGKIAYEEFRKTLPLPGSSNQCNELYPQKIAFLKRIIIECPNHANDLEKEYYDERLEMVDLCSKDSVTGEICMKADDDFKWDLEISYSNWEPYQCESSCVAEIDAIYREYANSPACPDHFVCSTFKDDKPLESCGNPDYYKNKSSSNSKSSTSDATTLSNHVALLSLLLCLLFSFFSFFSK